MRLSRPIAAVGFDLDHTLTKQGSITEQAVTENFEDVVREVLEFSIRCYDALKSTYCRTPIRDTFINAHLIAIRDHIRDKQVGVTEEAKAVIHEIHAMGLPMYIVSNAPGDAWGRRLTKDISPMMTQVLFREDVNAPKGDPNGILSALGHIDAYYRQQCVYVGNAKTDMQAAIRADVTPIAMGANSYAARYLQGLASVGNLQRGVVCGTTTEFSIGIKTGFEGQVIGYEP